MLLALFIAPLLLTGKAYADDYILDSKEGHAFIQFKAKHLGYSWVLGRFNEFNGTFSHDSKTGIISNVSATIEMESIDSNHAERDKHLRGGDFLKVRKFPEAQFESTGFKSTGKGKGVLKGTLTLLGKQWPVSINVTAMGTPGIDPWGGYRIGFEGRCKLQLNNSGIALRGSPIIDIFIAIEGVRGSPPAEEEANPFAL
ncbi:MAG: YceI family protein [Proteobacteria bacterium]|nr:YceI family protein [Pseudomonadota bacterium]